MRQSLVLAWASLLFLTLTAHADAPTYGGKTLEQWSKDLKTAGGCSGYGVVDSAYQLAKAPENRPLLPLVLKVLEEHPHHVFRESAARALKLIKPQDKDLLPALAAVTRSKHSDAAAIVGPSLRQFGLAGVAALADACGDKEPMVRRNAAIALGHMGSELELLTQAVAEPDERLRKDVARVLGPSGALRQALADADVRVRVEAAWALLRLGGDAGPSVNVLLAALASHTSDQYVRQLAGFDLGPVPAALVKEGLRSEDAGIRLRVTELLGQVGDKGRSAIPELRGALQDPVVAVRIAAANSLWGLGKVEGLVAILDSALSDKDEVNNVKAANVLESMGLAGADAVPRLILNLQGKETVQNAAARALARMGARARPAIPHLAAMLAKDRDMQVRETACRALAIMGAEAQEAVPALIDSLGTPKLRWHCIHALEQIRPPADTVVPALLPLLKPEEDGFHQTSNALTSLAPGDPRVVDAFIDVIRKTQKHQRYFAVAQLGKLGSGAKKAVPVLVEVLADKEEFDVARGTRSSVAALAGALLKKIDPESAEKAGVK